MVISPYRFKPSEWSAKQAFGAIAIGTIINVIAFADEPYIYHFLGGLWSGLLLAAFAVWIDDEKFERVVHWLSPKRASGETE